ncbi:CpsB/CapC family capsule biosynthesis tyrosine phosphatase, partial [Cetobacterium sp.]|uniref:CpsB/CapC family capsule biosynthesis tyrosine phosphatase n=1 Tax=Cetobacterium sp. TaxID=2071632 RepID=UPI003AEF4F78
MVDIHTHLLFGVDDGPKTLEESIEMIRDAINIGFNEFYLTSHYNKGRFSNENYDKNYEILKTRCMELNLKVKLHKG